MCIRDRLGLVLGIPEGIAVYAALSRGLLWDVGPLAPGPFVWLFGTTWVAIWAFAAGPIRILLPRWRFNGGRLL